MRTSSNTDLPRGGSLQSGHVNVVKTKMPVVEKINLRHDLHK